jgi:hypothetical protein
VSRQFEAARDAGLRRAGIAGRPTVRLEGDSLIVTGAREGRLAIAPEQVERMLIACTRARHGPLYETRIWRRGDEKPLLLMPRRSLDDKIESYPDIIRDFARRVAERGGIDRIRTGRGPDAGRIGILFAFAVLLLFGLFSLLFATVGGLWPFYPVTAFFLLLLWWAHRLVKHAKTAVPIASLDELEPELHFETKRRLFWEAKARKSDPAGASA